MVVGEPSLMGGEFGDEDERLITRLENAQFEAANGLEDPNNMGPGGPMGPGPGGPYDGGPGMMPGAPSPWQQPGSVGPPPPQSMTPGPGQGPPSNQAPMSHNPGLDGPDKKSPVVSQ